MTTTSWPARAPRFAGLPAPAQPLPEPATSPASVPYTIPDLIAHVRRVRRETDAVAAAVFGAALLVGTPALFALSWLAADHFALALPALWMAAGALAVAAKRLAKRRLLPRVSGRAALALLYGGLALAGPITLHAFVQAHRWAPDVWGHLASAGGFAGWVQVASLLVPLAHVVFAVLCARRGWRLGQPRPSGLAVVCASVAAASPALLYWGPFGLLPMIYVAVTAPLVLYALARLEAAVGARAAG